MNITTVGTRQNSALLNFAHATGVMFQEKTVRILLAISILLCCQLLLADEIEQKIIDLGYVEADILTPGSTLWNAANSDFDSLPGTKEKVLALGKDGHDEDYAVGKIFEADSIKYIGIDNGEWGGGLYINSYDKEAEPFFSGNIRALVPIGKDLYIVTGLAHMTFSGGAIHVIRGYEQPTAPERITLLPDAPEAITVGASWNGKKKLIIAGHSSLMTFVPDDDLEILVFNSFWSGLYPSYVVEYKRSFIIGIRSGLALVRYDKTGLGQPRVQYFVPNET